MSVLAKESGGAKEPERTKRIRLIHCFSDIKKPSFCSSSTDCTVLGQRLYI